MIGISDAFDCESYIVYFVLCFCFWSSLLFFLLHYQLLSLTMTTLHINSFFILQTQKRSRSLRLSLSFIELTFWICIHLWKMSHQKSENLSCVYLKSIFYFVLELTFLNLSVTSLEDVNRNSDNLSFVCILRCISNTRKGVEKVDWNTT